MRRTTPSSQLAVFGERDACAFPIQNLPFAVFRRASREDTFAAAWRSAIRSSILRARRCTNLQRPRPPKGFAGRRSGLAQCVDADGARSSGERCAARCSMPGRWLAAARLPSRNSWCRRATRIFSLPAHIGDYTDFYISIHHATAIGRMFRPDNPLLPNYKWIPIGYHGRSSSIGVSGQTFPRPRGQRASRAVLPPSGPAARLDYELEMGIFIGPGNAPGLRFRMADAEKHIFGLCLLNDWSARDLQGWEYQPLGPFLAKNFATTISPWIVTLEALAPFRVPPSPGRSPIPSRFPTWIRPRIAISAPSIYGSRL
jgi:fumarylacetoacetase